MCGIYYRTRKSMALSMSVHWLSMDNETISCSKSSPRSSTTYNMHWVRDKFLTFRTLPFLYNKFIWHTRYFWPKSIRTGISHGAPYLACIICRDRLAITLKDLAVSWIHSIDRNDNITCCWIRTSSKRGDILDRTWVPPHMPESYGELLWVH